MQRIVSAFVQNPDGSWFCRAPVHIVGPKGPATTTPGVTYRRGKLLNGYDVAQWLDEYKAHGASPLGVDFLSG